MTKIEGDQLLLQRIPQLLESELGLKDTSFKVISWIPLLYQGWELDPWAVIISLSDNKKILINSDHGKLIIEEKPEIFLKASEEQYSDAAKKCSEALKAMS